MNFKLQIETQLCCISTNQKTDPDRIEIADSASTVEIDILIPWVQAICWNWPPRENTLSLNVRTQQPKSALIIEKWEAKAPLDYAEAKSVGAINAAVVHHPQSESVNFYVPRLSLAIQRHHSLHERTLAILPVHQLPYSASSLVQLPVLPRQARVNRPLHTHMQYIRSSQSRLHNNFTTEVASMLDKWRSLEERGKSLQDASQKLLDERVRIASLTYTSLGCVEELDDCVVVLQDQLVELQTAIGTTLEYFQELEHATRLLNHPGESLVLQTDFLYMVERVDICIQFLKSHVRPAFLPACVNLLIFPLLPQRNSKEAEVYLLRFQQCMTRAMTLIKMYFVGSLRALTQDVSRRLFEQDVSDTAQMHLLYTRFTTVAGQLAPLLGEFERRAHSHPEELGALLSECHAAYFVARKNLLVSRLTEQIRGLDPTRTELVELHREAGSLTLDDEIEENEEKNDNLGRLHIRHLLQMVLQDAQTRLFFKAQAVIPTYDTILQRPKIWRTPISLLVCAAAQGAQTGYEIREKQSISHLFEVPGLNQHETWYPTLSKTPTIFYDLAHKAEITRNLDLVQKDEPQGGGGSGGTDQYGVADMLSSVLSRTSTLPLGSLFTSLDSMRAEHLANARRGIDQDLKHACESVISVASEPLRTPLRTFTGRPTSAAEAAVLDEAFRNACASDLRASIARVFLYVPDVRTAGVLVQHALDRVEDAYSAFSLAARQVGARAGKGQDCLMDDGLLKQLLQDKSMVKLLALQFSVEEQDPPSTEARRSLGIRSHCGVSRVSLTVACRSFRQSLTRSVSPTILPCFHLPADVNEQKQETRMGGSTYAAYHARPRCLREDASSLQSVGSDASSPGSTEGYPGTVRNVASAIPSLLPSTRHATSFTRGTHSTSDEVKFPTGALAAPLGFVKACQRPTRSKI
ncbi:hypothetical protein BGW80DRAFT_1259162 [Lactifluus volemus]|nr:hypothetical protein BGW80DRAFT_1259162 [Lactifluus volemus]